MYKQKTQAGVEGNVPYEYGTVEGSPSREVRVSLSVNSVSGTEFTDTRFMG